MDSMEVFLLAAISRGRLDSLYALQREAGLQPGNLLTLIRRLTASGLLTRAEEGKRRRKAMAITDSGARFLVENWKQALDIHRDMETVLRSTTVALLMDDIGQAVTFLLSCSSERENRKGIEPIPSIPSSTAAIHLYRGMKVVYQKRRDRLEAELAGAFGKSIAEHGLESQLQMNGQSAV